MEIVFIAFTLFMILAFLCPLIKSSFWFIRAFDFPRLQIIFLFFLYGCLSLFYIENTIVVAFILVFCLINFVLDLYRVGPYLPFNKTESEKGDRVGTPHINLLSSNVFVNNTAYDKILHIVEKNDPDLVLLLEPDMKWKNGVEKLESLYEYHVLVPKENTYGMLLYSKFKLINPEVKFLIDKAVPSIFTEIELKSGEIIEIICVHPRPPRPNESSSIQRDAELITIAKHVESKKDKPVLIFGDLNDVAWSHTTRLFKRISGTLDPRIGRGFYNTFPVKWNFLRVPLDHIFHTPSLAVRKIQILESIGSDHFPIMAAFDLLPSSEKSGEPEKKDSTDSEESEEFLEEGREYTGPYNEVRKEDE